MFHKKTCHFVNSFMVYYVYCIVAIGTNVKERNKTNLIIFGSDKTR